MQKISPLNNRSTKLRSASNVAISVVILVLFRAHLDVLLFGLFCSLPFGWLIIYLIFRERNNFHKIDQSSVGKQLTFFSTKVFTFIRISAWSMVVLGEIFFKQKLSPQNIFAIGGLDSQAQLALAYIILEGLATQLMIVALAFDTMNLFRKRNVYSETFNPKWKSWVAYGAIAFPFLIVGLLVFLSSRFT